MLTISVIIPTYNPNTQRLNLVLEGLKRQSYPLKYWELIIIDNNSSNGFQEEINLSWHLSAQIIREKKPGLTYARLKGFTASINDIVIMVDDDNILHENYLKESAELLEKDSSIGALGGKSLPLFESNPPSFIKEFYGNLALRDFGNLDKTTGWQNEYPYFAPIGAGMVIRKVALSSYIEKIKSGKSTISDRKGKSLSSGGDNDIVLEILKSGWQIGYFSSLSLNHIISKDRLTTDYLARLVEDSNKSWIHVLSEHKINKWTSIPKWTLPLRFFKAYVKTKAWANDVNYIRWKAQCGLFKGLSEI